MDEKVDPDYVFAAKITNRMRGGWDYWRGLRASESDQNDMLYMVRAERAKVPQAGPFFFNVLAHGSYDRPIYETAVALDGMSQADAFIEALRFAQRRLSEAGYSDLAVHRWVVTSVTVSCRLR